MNCQSANPLLLDFVYGALEGVESQSLEQHLTECLPCQKALIWAKNYQKKLRQASLEVFPELQFKTESLLNPAPLVPSGLARNWSLTHWTYLVAAAVFLLIFPIWIFFFNNENGQGPGGQVFVFADQPGRKTAFHRAQLELVFKEAVALAKDPNRLGQAHPQFSKSHFALSVDDPKSKELKTILFLPHISFSPGGQVAIQSISLNSADLRPADGLLSIRFTLKGPGFEDQKVSNGRWFLKDNQPALFDDGNPITGMGLVVFDLPDNVKSGPWEIEVSEANGRFPTIRNQIPTEGMKVGHIQAIRWDKTSYQPGEKAKLTVRISNPEGSPLPDTKVGLTIILGGKPWNPESTNTRKTQIDRTSDSMGLCELELVWPQKPGQGKNEILIQSRIGNSFLSEKQPLPF